MIYPPQTMKDTTSTQDHSQFSEREMTETTLVRKYGSNSLAFSGLNAHNSHFLTPGGTGLVNYRLVRNVAVVLGDPICAPEALAGVVHSFLTMCRQHHWHVAFYQASSDHVSTYRSLGLHTFKMGEEAILHPQGFTLRGSALANVRTSSRRAERGGVNIAWYEGAPPVIAMKQLEEISDTWLEHKVSRGATETGFSTGRLDEVMEEATLAECIAHPTSSHTTCENVPHLVTAIVTRNDGTACAFMTFTPIYASSSAHNESAMDEWGWSLDLMRRTPDAPPGVMELLLVRTLERFRSYGAQRLSLGLVALSDTRQEMTRGQRRLVGAITDHFHILDDRHTLFNFKQKFHPAWQSRYLVTNTIFALPHIALTILQLRNYSRSKQS